MLTLISISMMVSRVSRDKRCLPSFEGWRPDAAQLKCVLFSSLYQSIVCCQCTIHAGVECFGSCHEGAVCPLARGGVFG
jgi:hypothetical protein